MSGEPLPTKLEKDVCELRKLVGRFQALFETLKHRTPLPPTQATNEPADEAAYRRYFAHHELKKNKLEFIATAFLYSTPSTNPLGMIAKLIQSEPHHIAMLLMEKQRLEARQQILTRLVQTLINEQPMNMDEIRNFSEETVRREHEGACSNCEEVHEDQNQQLEEPAEGEQHDEGGAEAEGPPDEGLGDEIPEAEGSGEDVRKAASSNDEDPISEGPKNEVLKVEGPMDS